ncbi:MAG: ParB/RepB/Spo0J family partition protein [Succinivibrio sp.]|nr:ParB/RepB/Spo0J family partition protein [Succinivibrio sp.]
MKNFDQSTLDSMAAFVNNFDQQASVLDAGETTCELSLEQISGDPSQPRRHFDPEVIEGIAKSIETFGLIQPIIVRPDPHNHNRYLIVSGEQRFRAHQLLKRQRITCLIRETYRDSELPFVQYLENERRSSLKFHEKAEFITRLSQQGISVEDISQKLGLNKSVVYLFTRWADAPDFLRQAADHFVSMRPFADLLTLLPEHEEQVRHFLNALPADPQDENYILTRTAINNFSASLKQPQNSVTTENPGTLESAVPKPEETPAPSAAQVKSAGQSSPAGQGATSDPAAATNEAGHNDTNFSVTTENPASPPPGEQGIAGEQNDHDLQSAQSQPDLEQNLARDADAPATTATTTEQGVGQGAVDFSVTTENPVQPESASFKPHDCAVSPAAPTPIPEPDSVMTENAPLATYASLYDLPLLILSDGQQDYTYLPHLQAQTDDQLCALNGAGQVVELNAAGLTIKSLDRSRTLAELIN